MSTFIAGFDGHTCCNCGRDATTHTVAGACTCRHCGRTRAEHSAAGDCPATGAVPMGLLDGEWRDFRSVVHLDGTVSYYLDGERIRYVPGRGWVRAP